MLTPAHLAHMIESLEKIQCVTRRVISALPEDRLDWTPAPGARTPRRLIAHLYGSGTAHAAACMKGSLTREELEEAENTPEGGMEELLAWCEKQFSTQQQVLRQVDPKTYERPIECFYGTYPASMLLCAIHDEHWHHRGQLTVYLRLLGIEVPFLYSYD